MTARYLAEISIIAIKMMFRIIDTGMIENMMFLPLFSPLATIFDMATGKPNWVIVINKLYVGIINE